MKQNKISLAPQDINETVWYYENPESLEFVVYNSERDPIPTMFKVRASKLIKSLERMGYKISK